MEVQVNVAQDGGERIDQDFKGRQWHGWTDGTQVWKSFRIPYKAKSEPEYTDKEMKFDLSSHVEGIGCTGWDWVKRVSRWVAFDFDAISGHSEKHIKRLTDIELNEVREKVSDIPWVTVRRSTGGKGLHLYVFLDPVISTDNHTEHSALARSILGLMSAVSGFDFQAKVDICGGNMWIWHRKMSPENKGLELIKNGINFSEVPENWRDHVNVIKGRKKRSTPSFIETQNSTDTERLFEQLSGQRSEIELDEDHKKLINYLSENNCNWWWDQDHRMLVTHTYHLKQAHESLGLKGIFKTLSEGTEKGTDHNCFSGDTEFLTPDGPKTFAEMSGKQTKTYTLTDNGMQWVDARILSFGDQVTVPLTFGDGNKVRVTAYHEWLVCNSNGALKNKNFRKFTHELRLKNEYLPLANTELPIPSTIGIAHGFVYGDGWNKNTRGKETTEVALFGTDIDLRDILLEHGNPGVQKYKGSYEQMVRQLPNTWKNLPTNCSKEYAYGFILGLISADGHVNKTRPCIFQSDYDELIKIRKLAIFCGLRCHPIGIHSDSDSPGRFPNGKPCYRLSFNSYNIKNNPFIKREQKESFTRRIKNKSTTVSDIDWQSPIKEKVYCAVVPKFHNFTLANGVITGNCFLFPLKMGAWAVRRYSPGVAEDSTWSQDQNGWTRCYFNRDADILTASRTYAGIEHKSGGYVFREAEVALKAAKMLGVDISLPNWIMTRETKLKEHKDGNLLIEIKHESADPHDAMRGWLAEKNKWSRIFYVPRQKNIPSESNISGYDKTIRHIISETGDDQGWVLNTEKSWRSEPLVNVKLHFDGSGLEAKEVKQILGSCIEKPWTIVNRPFQEEYLGNREWNRNTAQLRFKIKDNTADLKYSTWMRILNHCGKGLDDAIRILPWAKDNGILTGGDYLKCWVSSLFQKPMEPLPYLFFYGNQNSGKSIFHEALSLLITKGYQRADLSLTNSSGFNGELENALICVVEETDLSKNRVAYNRIKDWVTSLQLNVRHMYRTPFHVPNMTKWIQCANHPSYCPVFPGDSRITMMFVDDIDAKDTIPKRELIPLLEQEASDFLTEILSLEIPRSTDRLNIPVVVTSEKLSEMKANRTHLEIFLEEKCHHVTGKAIKFSDFYLAYMEWLEPIYHHEWSKIKVGKELPPHFCKGRLPQTGHHFIGNISWEPHRPGDPELPKCIVQGEYLIIPKEGTP